MKGSWIWDILEPYARALGTTVRNLRIVVQAWQVRTGDVPRDSPEAVLKDQSVDRSFGTWLLKKNVSRRPPQQCRDLPVWNTNFLYQTVHVLISITSTWVHRVKERNKLKEVINSAQIEILLWLSRAFSITRTPLVTERILSEKSNYWGTGGKRRALTHRDRIMKFVLY